MKEMRRRVTAQESFANNGRTDASRASPGSLQRLKRLDIYSSPKQEFQRRTLHGAVVSLVLAVLATLLVWRELRFSMESEMVENLFVNATITSKVNVTFDITFPRIACAFISLDAEDVSGVPQRGLLNDVTRRRLTIGGQFIEREQTHGMGNTLKDALAQHEVEASKSNRKEDDCSCYGAGTAEQCCKTCQDVRAAYRRKGWKIDIATIPICAGETQSRENWSRNSPTEVDSDEGCRLAGSLEMTATEGNFHFAPGNRQHRRPNSMTFMEHVQVALESFNTTHTIHSLSFGNQPDADLASARHVASSSALTGHKKTVLDTHAMHQYFLQLVPTTYRFLDGSTLSGSQYSVSEHLKHVHAGPSRGLPGVYFYYNISPVQAIVEHRRKGVLSFLTSVCGLVGGTYSILGLVNTAIGRVVYTRARTRKI